MCRLPSTTSVSLWLGYQLCLVSKLASGKGNEDPGNEIGNGDSSSFVPVSFQLIMAECGDNNFLNTPPPFVDLNDLACSKVGEFVGFWLRIPP